MFDPLPRTIRQARIRLAIATKSIAMALAMLWCLPTTADSVPRTYRQRLEELRKERSKSKSELPADKPILHEGKDYVDELLAREWQSQGLRPSADSTDGEYLRRATLDVVGRIPTIEETRAFLADKSKSKRAELVDRLLASSEYGSNFATVWVRLLVPADLMGQEANVPALHAWLEREFNRGRPWNEIVAELLAANGRWDENPAVNFILANQDGDNSIRTTSNVTRLFLGVQTQCTECHDHPWNDWKQEQFHGLNAFFLGTEEKRVTRGAGGRQTDFWALEEQPFSKARAKGVFFERRNGLSVFTEPTYLDGRSVEDLIGAPRETTTEDILAILDKDKSEEGEIYLRRELARAVTSPDNPYFAKAIVNRLWFHFFGHSFTKSVDDFDNGVDEPTNPELLERLAADFQSSGYDLKQLVRWIATSSAYGLSSQSRGKPNEEAIGFFATQLVRPLSPEQLYDSVLTLTRIDRTSASANSSEERSQFLREFLETFGSEEIPTGAPRYDGTITQGLMLMNSAVMNRATSCVPGSFLHGLVTDESLTDKARIEAIYLAALSRKPTSGETKLIAPMLASIRTPEDRSWVLSDVLWAALNSAEFALNH